MKKNQKVEPNTKCWVCTNENWEIALYKRFADSNYHWIETDKGPIILRVHRLQIRLSDPKIKARTWTLYIPKCPDSKAIGFICLKYKDCKRGGCELVKVREIRE